MVILQFPRFDFFLHLFFVCFIFQSTKGQRYRFSVLVNELKHAKTSPYKATCLAFINSIIIASDEFDERIRIRNEFIGEILITISYLVLKVISATHLDL